MSRNRMKNSQSLHWMGVLKWIIMFALVAGLGLCYMICKNQNLHLAEESHSQEKRLAEIEQRNAELQAGLSSMKSLKLLERRLIAMHSSLVPWGDPQANWVRLDQNTRARLAKIGTTPQATLNFESSVATANAAAQAGH
jgi:hypothetical protein